MTPQRRSAFVALSVFALALTTEFALGALSSWGILLRDAGLIALSLVALWPANGLRPAAALRELGLRGALWAAARLAIISSTPMLLILAASSKVATGLSPIQVLRFDLLGPTVEEILFRGCLFRQLYRRAGWSFWLTIAATAGVFGLAHLGNVAGEGPRVIVGEVAITSLGGAFFSWLF